MDKIEKIKGWVARDDDGTLAIHYEKPRRVCYYNNEIVSDGTPWVWENEAGYGLLPVKIFPDLKWEDEPLEVELTIKRVSTLSEEPDKSLEEAAWDCVLDSVDVNNPVLLPKYKELLTYLFIAGAEWQKEQMLKDAVEVTVKEDAGGYPYIDMDIPLAKRGDKVRIIIMKEEDEK